MNTNKFGITKVFHYLKAVNFFGFLGLFFFQSFIIHLELAIAINMKLSHR
jgi:hypothetical protein